MDLPRAENLLLERRRRRTEDVSQALRHQLEACTDGSALLLADATGLCLACAGPRRLCEEVVAWLPLLDPWRDDADGAARYEVAGYPAHVQRVWVLGSELFLCAIGERDATEALARSALGVARILHCAN
jgi:hypothetical protein